MTGSAQAAGGTGSGDPYVRARVRLEWRGTKLDLLAPHSGFSSSSIDPGTRLLIDHLPGGEPGAFLDIGCGYGAPGLAIAARFPRSSGLLIDRDLLAVEFARRNAVAARLENVTVGPSLGLEAVPRGAAFDWILANLPARAGPEAVRHLVAEGRARLAPGGELFAVIIAPLAGSLDAAAVDPPSPRRVAASDRHIVVAFQRSEPAAAGSPRGDKPYDRDEIDFSAEGLYAPLRLVRPTDLADEPDRLPRAVPLLARALPAPASFPPKPRILVFRSGYGLVTALALARFSDATITALDRDLLATAFTRRNCAFAEDRLRVLEAVRPSAARPGAPYDLILGELLPPLGPAATLEELRETRELLAPGGIGLIIGLSKQWREFLRDAAESLGLEVAGSSPPAALYRMLR